MIFQKNIETSHYMFNFVGLQKSRIKTVRDSIKNLNKKDIIVINTFSTKYMLYGKKEEQVKDIKTYIKELDKVTNLFNPLAVALGKIASNDLFSIVKSIGSALTGKKEDFFKEKYTTYTSDILLGLVQVVAGKPNDNTYDLNKPSSIGKSYQYFHLSVDRLDKIRFGTLTNGTVVLECTVTDALELLDKAEILLSNISQLTDISKKVSSLAIPTLLSKVKHGNFAFGIGNISERADAYTDTVKSDIFKTTGILVKYIYILYDCTGACFNFSLGHIKKATSIAKAIGNKAS